MTSDRVLGAVCLVLGLAFMFGASRIQTGFILDPLGPKTFPMIIGGILVVSSIVPLVKPDPAPGWPSAQAMMEIALALAVFVGYAVVLPELGFVPATALAAAAPFPPPRPRRGPRGPPGPLPRWGHPGPQRAPKPPPPVPQAQPPRPRHGTQGLAGSQCRNLLGTGQGH